MSDILRDYNLATIVGSVLLVCFLFAFVVDLFLGKSGPGVILGWLGSALAVLGNLFLIALASHNGTLAFKYQTLGFCLLTAIAAAFGAILLLVLAKRFA